MYALERLESFPEPERAAFGALPVGGGTGGGRPVIALASVPLVVREVRWGMRGESVRAVRFVDGGGGAGGAPIFRGLLFDVPYGAVDDERLGGPLPPSLRAAGARRPALIAPEALVVDRAAFKPAWHLPTHNDARRDVIERLKGLLKEALAAQAARASRGGARDDPADIVFNPALIWAYNWTSQTQANPPPPPVLTGDELAKASDRHVISVRVTPRRCRRSSSAVRARAPAPTLALMRPPPLTRPPRPAPPRSSSVPCTTAPSTSASTLTTRRCPRASRRCGPLSPP